MPSEGSYYWADDPYWTDALDGFASIRDSGEQTITLDIASIDEALFQGDGPAYRLLNAMDSVQTHEGMDGYRGAPRLVFALLYHLQQLKR